MPRRFLSRSSIGKLDIRVRRRFGRDANSAETESIRMKIAPPYTQPNSKGLPQLKLVGRNKRAVGGVKF